MYKFYMNTHFQVLYNWKIKVRVSTQNNENIVSGENSSVMLSQLLNIDQIYLILMYNIY